MTASSSPSADHGPILTRAGVIEGARLVLAVQPGAIFFAAAVGSLAAQKGLTLAETVSMYAFVFAGLSQFVALGSWPEVWTWGAVASLTLMTFTVNSRMILMGASLRPWLAPLPAAMVYPMLFINADANWLTAMRHRAEGGRDVGILLGGGLLIWVVWVIAAVPGYLIGALITNPRAIGLDLVVPAFFTAMLVPLWKKPAQTIGWLVAGLVSVAVWALVPGHWYVLAGAIAGSVAGGIAAGRAEVQP